MPVCYVVGAGEFVLRGFYPKDGDIVIAADNGYTALKAAEITPDLLVGDFDSLMQIPRNIPCKSFAPEKDDTDLALALLEGEARGYRTFRLYGASGGRADHMLANLQLLGGLSRKGFGGKMICRACDIYALTDGTLQLPKLKAGTIISVFCYGEKAEGVTLQGMKYPLDHAVLTAERPLGISNESMGETACVTVEKGTLLVYVML